MEVAALSRAIDELAAVDPDGLADQASIEALERELTRLEAVVSRAVAAFDASGNWSPEGARDCPSWLMTRCHLRRSDAKQQLRRGRRQRQLPALTEAWLAGKVTGAHLDLVGDVGGDTTAEALARDEAMLAEQAVRLRFNDFGRVVAYWRQMADPEGTDADADRQRGKRAVWLDQSYGGVWLGKLALDPISGAIVGGEIERLAEEMFRVEWAELRDRLGREPTVADLERSPAQRRADALVEMATRSKAATAGDRRPLPLFTVFVNYELVHGRICELEDGTVIAPGTLDPWLNGAEFERALFAPDARVEVAPAVRFFTGATRRAIAIRDRRCRHPYCDRPARRCEGDHKIPYSQGGPTTQENGQLMCGFHNRWRNQPPPKRE
ncbi:MAG TPA: DUF222 domain-containing protein [Acidimicrobiales bacterium]|nr:DUF222 domain-containing protein [Acidimicrobiales bacterium]